MMTDKIIWFADY